MAAAGLGVLLATLPCSSPTPEELCEVRSLVLEKPHASQDPAVPAAQNQEASLSLLLLRRPLQAELGHTCHGKINF